VPALSSTDKAVSYNLLNLNIQVDFEYAMSGGSYLKEGAGVQTVFIIIHGLMGSAMKNQ